MKRQIETNRSGCRHAAFTLVELLVVIAIIGVLIGLMLPGIQSLREAGRRSLCQQHLVTLGLGMSAYHHRWESFPAGTVAQTGPIRNEAIGLHHNWLGRLLNVLGEPVVAKHLKTGQSVYADANQPVLNLQFPLVTCPSNSNVARNTSCFAGIHHDVEAPIDENNNGVLILNRAIASDEISDGLSYTLMLGEKVSHPADDLGWLSGTRSTLRNTGHPPAKAIVQTDVLFQPADPTDTEASLLFVGGLGSQHPGGLHLMTTAGEVQFRAAQVDLKVLQQMANRQDGTLPIQWSHNGTVELESP